MIGPEATVGEAVNVIVHCFRRSVIEAQGATSNYDKDIISKGKAGTMAPKDYGSTAERIKGRLIALAKIAEVEMGAALWGRKGFDSQHPARKATREAVLQEEGCPPAELAFLFRISEDHVRRIRREAGRDPDDGSRLAVGTRSITEPPAETLRRQRRGDL